MIVGASQEQCSLVEQQIRIALSLGWGGGKMYLSNKLANSNCMVSWWGGGVIFQLR